MSILDQIYEAAFRPELWPDVLAQIADGNAMLPRQRCEGISGKSSARPARGSKAS